MSSPCIQCTHDVNTVCDNCDTFICGHCGIDFFWNGLGLQVGHDPACESNHNDDTEDSELEISTNDE